MKYMPERRSFQPERKEKEYYEKFAEMIQEKRRLADGFLKAEKMIFEGEHPTDSEKFQQLVETFPEHIGNNIIEINFKYRERIGALNRKLKELGSDWDIEQPEQFGRKLFEASTGEKPKGKVTIVNEGSYLLVRIFSRNDTKKFMGDYALGTFHRASPIGIFDKKGNEKKLPIITISEGYDSEVVAKTLVHERQHFINDLVGFYTPEGEYEVYNDWRADIGKKYDESKIPHKEMRFAMANVKDELLAYLRDNTDPRKIHSILERSYQNLFEEISEEEQKEILDTIKEIGELLTQLDIQQSYANHEDPRGVLVYFLLDIPLNRMASFLRKFIDSQQEVAHSKEWKRRSKVEKDKTQRLIDDFEAGIGDE